MYRRQPQQHRCILFTLAAFFALSALGSGRAVGQLATEIIGNGLDGPQGITVDAAGLSE